MSPPIWVSRADGTAAALQARSNNGEPAAGKPTLLAAPTGWDSAKGQALAVDSCVNTQLAAQPARPIVAGVRLSRPGQPWIHKVIRVQLRCSITVGRPTAPKDSA